MHIVITYIIYVTSSCVSLDFVLQDQNFQNNDTATATAEHKAVKRSQVSSSTSLASAPRLPQIDTSNLQILRGRDGRDGRDGQD